MASISTAIELTDRISSPLDQIQQELHQTTEAFEDVDAASNRLETGFGRLAQYIGGLGIAYMVQQEVSRAIEYASDLTEVQNVVDVSFGDSAERVNEWSKTTLEAFGLNELSAKRFAGTMGAMLKSSGLAGDVVEEMAIKMAELSGDMASFYNLQGQEAFYKIRAGISGETEPLKELGINMSVANLEAYALSQGIATTYDKMSQAEQTMLRYNYLLYASKDAQGDFGRTAMSYANQQRLLTENIKEFTGELASGLLPILTRGLALANDTVKFVASNWSLISPLVTSLTASYLVYAVAQHWATVQSMGFGVVAGAMKLKLAALSVATFAQTVAQQGLNAAIAACPISWIIIGVIMLLGAIYACAAAVVEFTDTTHTAFGLIAGSVAAAGAFIFNIFVGVLQGALQVLYTVFLYPFLAVIEWVTNACNDGFNSFGDAVSNLIGQIIGWFLSLGGVVTKIIDAIFGTNWTAGLEELKAAVTAWGKNDKAITLNQNMDPGVQRIEYGAAFEAGANWGDNIGKSMSEMLNPAAEQTAMSQTAANTGAMLTGINALKNGVDISNEQLQYMRDVAEQEAINRYTTAEIKIEMQNNNNISRDVDAEDFIQRMTEGLREQMAIAAEGVH